MEAPMATKEELEKRVAELERQLEDMTAEHAKKVAQSQEVLRQVLNVIPIRVFWKDKNLNYLGCNRLFAGDAGLDSPDDLIGKDDYQMAWAEQAELYRADDWQVIDSGKSKIDFEEPQTTPEGTTIWLCTSKIPLRDANDNIIGVVGIYDDITERKQTEIEHERMLSIIENSADFIALTTPEGQGLYINAAGLEKIGYTQEEFDAGMNITQVQPDLSPEVFQIAISEGMWSGEGTLIHKNGEKIIISQTITSLKDKAGNLRGFSTIIRDITEIKQNEAERERLQKEIIEAQQRAIAELSTPVIPIMDRVIVMPMVGSIDSMRARDITRALLAGIGHHRAKVVILDVTGVSLMDTGIVNHLNKTIQAARLKGAQTIVTGISDAVAESIVDLGIDWSAITTLSDLQTGLLVALESLNYELNKKA